MNKQDITKALQKAKEHLDELQKTKAQHETFVEDLTNQESVLLDLVKKLELDELTFQLLEDSQDTKKYTG